MLKRAPPSHLCVIVFQLSSYDTRVAPIADRITQRRAPAVYEIQLELGNPLSQKSEHALQVQAGRLRFYIEHDGVVQLGEVVSQHTAMIILVHT